MTWGNSHTGGALMRPYSIDLRERIVAAIDRGEHSLREFAPPLLGKLQTGPVCRPFERYWVHCWPKRVGYLSVFFAPPGVSAAFSNDATFAFRQGHPDRPGVPEVQSRVPRLRSGGVARGPVFQARWPHLKPRSTPRAAQLLCPSQLLSGIIQAEHMADHACSCVRREAHVAGIARFLEAVEDRDC